MSVYFIHVYPSRNAFNWVSYFFFLYNAIVGFLGAIVRALLAMLFGILLLFRLDTNIMMRGLQFADLGNQMELATEKNVR